MIETQKSIAEWAEQFGPATDRRIVVRALEECVELLRLLTAFREDEALPWHKVREEAADVAIVLCRLAERHGVTLPIVSDVGYVSATPFEAATVACWHLANALRLGPGNDHYSYRMSVQALRGVAPGGDLQSAIDHKMTINRQRTWRVENGVAYHVK